jgi:hypothetical protein
MSSTRDTPNAPGERAVLSRSLLALGLYALVLGEATQLADTVVWTIETDLMIGPFFLGLFLILVASLLILVSLLSLKVHWLLVMGVVPLALLASFVQGRLFPTNPAYWAAYWFLTFGSVVVALSLILLGRVKGIWPALWRVLLVTGAGAAIALAVQLIHGPDGWTLLISLVVGVLILIVEGWKGRQSPEPSGNGR